MSTTLTIIITLTGGHTFTVPVSTMYGTTFNVIAPPTTINPVFTILSTTTASTPATSLVLTPGSKSFILSGFVPTLFSPTPTINGTIVGTANFIFNDVPSSSTIQNLIFFSAENQVRTNQFNVSINCIHGSSLITMKDGFKRIDEIKVDDEVLSEGKYVKILEIPHCWLSFNGVDHDALIFEVGSLGENQPNKRLIIDAGHPICKQEEYDEKGFEALRPAGEFYEELQSQNSKLISTKKWTDVFVQSEPSRRYDLVLEEPYRTYTANGIIVQSKGYKDHRYKNFV